MSKKPNEEEEFYYNNPYEIEQVININHEKIYIKDPRPKTFTCYGALSGRQNLYYYPPSYQTIAAAYQNRHIEQFTDTYDTEAPRLIYDHIEKFIIPFREPMDPESFIDNITDVGKKKLYQDEYEKYLATGLLPTHITPFTKIEKMSNKKYKAPRMIQARNPAFNVELGCFLKKIETQLTKYSEHKVHFGKGDYNEIANRIKTLSEKYEYYYEADHKSFDAHVTVEMKKTLHKFYAACYARCPRIRYLKGLLKNTIINKCISREGDRYTVRGTVMSGEIDTSLGNSIMNYGILKAALHHCGVEGDVIVQGDDSIIFTKSKLDKQQFIDFLKTLNMETEVGEPTRSIHQVSFCQTKLVHNNSGEPTMMPDPAKMALGFGMTYKIPYRKYARYIEELILAMVHMNCNNPIGTIIAKAHGIEINLEKVATMTLPLLEKIFVYKLHELIPNEIDDPVINATHLEAYPEFCEDLKDLIRITKMKPIPKPCQSYYVDHDNKFISPLNYLEK